MAIIALKAWYLKHYEPIKTLIKKPCTLRLNRNSLLKTGLRADFLDDRTEVEGSTWFQLYLEGRNIEFYIQGSGSYIVSNIDLVSQEIYFTKCNSISGLEPIIYYAPQNHNLIVQESITNALENVVANLSTRSRIPLTLEVTPRNSESPLRLSNSQFRKITKSLLLIADITPVSTVSRGNQSSLIIDPNVCIELGYGIQSKDNGQILLLKMANQDLEGVMPFDMPGYRQLTFDAPSQVAKSLPKLVDTLLQRYNLF